MAKQELTCDDILKELRAKQYRPKCYTAQSLPVPGQVRWYR